MAHTVGQHAYFCIEEAAHILQIKRESVVSQVRRERLEPTDRTAPSDQWFFGDYEIRRYIKKHSRRVDRIPPIFLLLAFL
jgi:hypothetical protein